MSPNLFHNNVRSCVEDKDIDHCRYLSDQGCYQASRGLNGNISPVTNDPLRSMEQNNGKPPKMLRNTLKAENLKSKIDLLIMNKTKANTMPAAQDETEENIQSIQEEINNLFTGRLNAVVTPNSPAMDAKNTNNTKLPMSPAKPGDSRYNMNHPTTVDNVEHLLETMFRDSKTNTMPPAKANPPLLSKANSITATAAATDTHNVEHLLESMFQDSRTSPVKANAIPKANSPAVPSSKQVEHLLESVCQDNRTSPSRVKPPRVAPDSKNVERLLESMFHDGKSSPAKANSSPVENNSKHSNKKGASPRISLSDEAIESILRTPSPVDESDNDDVKQSTRSNRSHARNKTPTSSPSGQAPFHPNSSSISQNNSSTGLNNSSPSQNKTPRQPLRSSRLRKRSTYEESLDESSSDSTKLEIVDDFLGRSRELHTSAAGTKSCPLDRNSLNCHEIGERNELNSASNCEEIGGGSERPACKKSTHEMQASNSIDVKDTCNIKQEQPSPPVKCKPVAVPAGKESGKPPSMAAKNPIMAVENELEKMFAGIVKEEECPATNCKAGVKTEDDGIGNRKYGNGRSNRRRSSEFFPSSPEPLTSATPPKRKKKSKQMSGKTSGGSKKKGSCSSSSARVSLSANRDTSSDSLSGKAGTAGVRVTPFVRLYTSSQRALVVNSTRGDEEALVGSTGGGAGSKKPAGFVPNKKMRLSAQSNLQPANRTDGVDPTWVCVFCRRGPNTHGPAGNPLGDLFGPYRVGPPQEGYLDGDEFKRRVARGSDQAKKKRSISMDVDLGRLTAGLTKVTAESGTPDCDVTTSSSSKSSPTHTQYEVWFHEACVVWGSGVYLVGGSLLGLDQCVWAALNNTCVNCGETGASIGCVKSKCRGSVHYSCALHIGWYLDPTTFVASCSVHREQYSAERYLGTPGSDVL